MFNDFFFPPRNIYLFAIERSLPRGRTSRETMRTMSPRGFSPRVKFHHGGTVEPRSPALTVTMDEGRRKRRACFLVASRLTLRHVPLRYVSNFRSLFSIYLPLFPSLALVFRRFEPKVQMSATSRLRTMTSLTCGSDFLPSLQRTRLKGSRRSVRDSLDRTRRSRTISPTDMYNPRWRIPAVVADYRYCFAHSRAIVRRTCIAIVVNSPLIEREINARDRDDARRRRQYDDGDGVDVSERSRRDVDVAFRLDAPTRDPRPPPRASPSFEDAATRWTPPLSRKPPTRHTHIYIYMYTDPFFVKSSYSARCCDSKPIYSQWYN